MFSSLLIANRGEIACRVIRTARTLGIRTIAVYSDADAGALHTKMADEAVRIGPAPAAESYLRAKRIVAAAVEAGADAIHPGYGFLAENAAFAEACAKAGITFVGPPPAAIRAMGLKDGAKALMEKAGVPVVPGYHGEKQDSAFLKRKAYETGYPVLIKAVAGGGGKGMRRVDKAIEFDDALAGAVREATGAFDDPRVLIEKYVAAPRHIEVQVMADGHGAAVHLFERDCSLQRRHQKVIEEAPAPGMTPGLRSRMGDAAVQAALAVGYEGAGTVEFIVDASKPLSDETPFYFMEMNTRLQVEHPVTEAITGLDLVTIQLRVAAGEPLDFTQDDLTIDGHAVEARLYAEDTDAGFLPSVGVLEALDLAAGEGVRVDTGVREGDAVTPFYDPMIAKVVAHGPDRDAALDRLAAALRQSLVAGPKTNLTLLAALLDAPSFRAGAFDTGTIERELAALLPPRSGLVGRAVAMGAAHLVKVEMDRLQRLGTYHDIPWPWPWDIPDTFQFVPERRQSVAVEIDGETHEAIIVWKDGRPVAEDAAPDDGTAVFVAGRERTYLLLEGRQFTVGRPLYAADEVAGSDGQVRAPMHGRVTEIAVKAGQAVARGDRIAVVEAMKMEHTVAAPLAGTVASVSGEVGAQVLEGAVLAIVEPIAGGTGD